MTPPMKVMQTPRSVDVSITSKCNLKCVYCFHFNGPADTNTDLPTDEWLRFFKELRTCSVLRIILGGGEPFIRDDLQQIISEVVRNRMRFTALTNGTLVTEEHACFIAETGRCDTIQVSIDGANPTVHDAARGDGTFLKAVAGIENLKKYGVPVSVRVTIHRHNVRYLQEIARFLLEDLDLPGFSTNSATYLGRCRYNAGDIRLTIDEHSEAMTTLLELKQQYNGRIFAEAGPLADAMAWIEMEGHRRKGVESIEGKGYLTSCGGVFSRIAVRSDGVIVPCTQMSHIKLGHILEDDLKKVWQQHPVLQELRDRKKISLGEFDFCRDCIYIPYCTGGCPAEAFTTIGDEFHPNPNSCLRQFLLKGGSLPFEFD